MFCRKRRKVCRGCECFAGSVGKFAGGAGCLPEAAVSLRGLRLFCGRRRNGCRRCRLFARGGGNCRDGDILQRPEREAFFLIITLGTLGVKAWRSVSCRFCPGVLAMRLTSSVESLGRPPFLCPMVYMPPIETAERSKALFRLSALAWSRTMSPNKIRVSRSRR